MTRPTDEVQMVVRDTVATITFNRPARKNAFTLEMMDTCAGLINAAATDDAIGCIVLTGGGDAFCSGIELTALAAVDNDPRAHRRMLTRRIHHVLYAVEQCDKPLIAAINGPAVGAGLDMALACDLRIAGRSARMSEGYIKIGLIPGDGGCFYLPALVGLGRALDLLLTGRFVDAAEAQSIGMVNQVVADSDLLATATELAHGLAGQPVEQMGMIKRAARSSARMALRDHLDLMASHLAVAMSTEPVQRLLATAEPPPPSGSVAH